MSDSSHWLIGPIKSLTIIWAEKRGTNIHQCHYRGLLLLTGERAGFCCGKQGWYLLEIPPLPPLPPQYNVFITHPQILSLSCILNLIFSFTSLETAHQFPEVARPPGFFAIQGRIYHCVMRSSVPCTSLPFFLTPYSFPPSF